MPNRLLLAAAESKRLEEFASNNKLTRPIIQRYVAGTTLAEALNVSTALNRDGMDVSLDLLGESVTDVAQADVATDEYLRVIERLPELVPGQSVSVKLSQLGVALSSQRCEENLRRLLVAAREHGSIVEVDMEHSSVGRETMAIFRRIQEEFPETRMAIQANMRSTLEDLTDFKIPPRVRLVKGAFLESRDLAIKDADDVTEQYKYLSVWALKNLPDPAFGTHDDTCVDVIKTAAAELGIDKQSFEFQMLQGVRRPLQDQLVRDGYRVRIYLPYGTQWYPYLTRRMAEKPANLLLFLRSLAG
ncbi:proline dehydrogenase family protein [Nocardioides sp.]|uniref:proline dehydrogenase family protein n=1 Tax=Nocardioides sp. TaxID=35761 RepID=UPI0019B37868|nr:proline dehydrogenase family protein [Nocardioides sp.]MBC7279617.1 proline dehydrogenase family protein [Nocardioides sp.]